VSSLTMEAMRQAIERVRHMETPPNLTLYDNPYLTETVQETITVKLPFRERWIEPLLHPVIRPFQPWVKEREETVTRTVPSRKILQTPHGLFVHPVMRPEVERMLAAKRDANDAMRGAFWRFTT